MKYVIVVSFFLLFSSNSCTKKSQSEKKTSSAFAEQGNIGSSILDPSNETDPAKNFHNPAPCYICHEEHRPALPHNQTEDCVGCHSFPDWVGVAASFNHDPTPETCIDCHSEKRPEPPHSTDGDCVDCHAFPDWRLLVGNAEFNHLPKPESCEQCHTRPGDIGQRAYPNQGPPAGFEANNPIAQGGGHYIGRDCISCHETPADGASGFLFSHAEPNPGFCLPCHFNDGQQEHPNRNNVTLSDFGNCYECHKNFDQTTGRNWRRGNGN